MCGLWRILLVSCWETLVGRFFGSGKSWSLPALAENDWFLVLLFFGAFMGKFRVFERSAGWEGKHPACDLSLPIWARPADMVHASPLGQWDKGQLKEGAGSCGRWLLIPFLTLSCVLRQPRDTTNGQRLCAISQCLLLGTKHPTSSSSTCNQKRLCNNFSSLPTCPAFEPRGERLCYTPELS